jgi:hypothetical protein
MRHEPRRVARRKIASRINGGDFGKKPGLASVDETPSRYARKFFYCQKPRLRVRGDGFLPAPISCSDIDHRVRARCANQKTPAAHVFLVISTIAALAFSRTTRIVAATRCRVVEPRAPPVGASVRQHFLKRDAVFFDVLVYSGCSASRFPSARSN